MMNSFVDYVINKSNDMDLILKMNYSNYVGWTIKIHKKGSDMPIVNITETDKGLAFSKAMVEFKRYTGELK